MDNQSSIDFASLGKRVWQRRQELELTQGELAKRVGVTTSFIGHIERAEKVPSLETVVKLSLELDMTLDQLILGRKGNCEGKACPLFGELAALLADYGLNT